TLTGAQIERLTERTDGWIAGIRLALIAVQQAVEEQIDTTIEALSAHQWLDDYIVEEVLDLLPKELRNFVLRTTSLGTLEPRLCDDTLGITNSAVLINELARRLVFVRRDTRSGIGVAYHALFAECVTRIAERMLPPGELFAQHARAGAWLQRHGQFEEALEHAIAIEDWSLALRALRGICTPLWERDLHHSLLHWMAKLPIEHLRVDHELLYWYIHKLFSTGRVRDAINELDVAEPLWQASGNPEEAGFAMGCRALKASFDGNLEMGLHYTYRALHYLPEHHRATRMRAWSNICGGEFSRGNDELAAKAYEQAEYCRRLLPAEQRWWTLLTEIVRVDQYALRGRLPTAERLYRVALDQLQPQFRESSGKYHFRLAAIYLEWNELERAQAEVNRFIHDPDRFPWQTWYVEAWLLAARIALANGQIETAASTLDRLFFMMEEHGESHTAIRARAMQAMIRLAQGELVLAGAWGDSVQVDQRGWATTFEETDPLAVLIQLRMAQQNYTHALLLATTRLGQGTERKRYAELIPLYVWQAAALNSLDRFDEAIDALRAALKLGIPGGFNQSFFPPGVDVSSLYHEAKLMLAPAEAAYIDALLRERVPSQERTDVPVVVSRGVVELLSPRERETLELIREGMSSREIADRLFVGESTIKKHLTRIFQKLKVANRTAAVIRAQELGILE
ncbi:MAG: LuxR C-terminal-related transcriptional regulator, partial [Thermomicrobiales bacterium]